MYKVVKNEMISEGIYLLEVIAPLVVKKCLPGQFCIVMANETSERIPLTIYKYDRDAFILSMIYQVVGASTLELTSLKDEIYSVVGPLGNPSELVINVDTLKNKRVLFVAGGVGIAPVMPQITYLISHGVLCDLVYGAKTKKLIILEDEIKKIACDYVIMTDDGSYGKKGTVVDAMDNLEKYDECVAIGPVVMMKYVSLKTKDKVPTIVSMNPIMVDGTGMCGACRLIVDGEVKFACVDGPEFDGHQVDFDLAIERMNIYKTFEGRKYLEMLEGKTHHGGCGECNHE